jgi:outer membrane receptor for ferrienterochelin and colicins
MLAFIFILGPGWAASQESEKEPARLDEIVVTGTRTPHTLKDVPVETVVVTREDIENSNAQTVTDVIKTIPGISAAGVDDVFGSTSARVRLNGLSFNDGYGLILIDGQRVHGSGQSGAHGEYAVGLNQIPVSMIEKIEVVKGPSSVLYGSDAMTGVINIITRKTPRKMTGGASAAYGWYKVKESTKQGVTTKPSDDGENRNLTETSAYFGDHPYERIGYLLSHSFENGQSTGQDPVESKRSSAMAKVDFKLSDEMDLRVKGEVSDFERGGTSTSDEDSYRIDAGWTFRPSQDHVLQVMGYHYNDHFDSLSTSSHRHGEIGYDQMETQYTWYVSNNQSVTTGAEFQRQGIDYVMDNANGTKTTVLEDVDTWSLYAQDELTFFDHLVVVPGLRYDNHSTFGDSFNPKLSLMYRLSGSTTLRGSVGKSFKSPTIRQLYYDVPFYHGPFWIRSNPDLEPEKSIGYQASIEQWLLNEKISLSLGYFRNDIEDMVVDEISNETFNGEELRVYKNVNEAMTQGVEFMARVMLEDNLSLSAGYTYTESEDKSTGNELTYTPRHAVSLSPSYEYTPWGLGASATYSYFSRQFANTDNTTDVDAHSVVDAKIFKRMGKLAKLSLEADNLFDSDQGDKTSFRSGRVLLLRMNFDF